MQKCAERHAGQRWTIGCKHILSEYFFENQKDYCASCFSSRKSRLAIFFALRKRKMAK